jgi:Phage integrase, N-terminal SAM-like domain
MSGVSFAAGTFRDVAEKFLTANDRQNRYWRETRRLIEQKAYPFFGSQPIATITRSQIAALIDRTEVRSKSAARLLFAALRPLFAWALERDAIDKNSP